MKSSSVDVSINISLFYKTAVILVMFLLVNRVSPILNIDQFVLVPHKAYLCCISLLIGGGFGLYCNSLIRLRELKAWRVSTSKISFYYICYVIFSTIGIIFI